MPSFNISTAWKEARTIVWSHRRGLALGLFLTLISRFAGLILPGITKFLIDDVLVQKRSDLLPWLAGAAFGATLIQAITSFLLAKLLGIAAWQTITGLRMRVQQHVMRLPVSYFEAHKSGELIQRIMSDAEGIRNLVGTGLVQLFGGFLTATAAFAILFYLNWRLTISISVILLAFLVMMVVGFRRLRPIFRARQKILAEVSGRLGEALGGIRVVKAFTSEQEEDRIFEEGANRLLDNVRRSITGVTFFSSLATVVIGCMGVVMILVGGGAIIREEMTLGELVMYLAFTALMASPLIQMSAIGTQLGQAFAGLDRMRGILTQAREDEAESPRPGIGRILGRVEFRNVSFAYEPGQPVLKEVSFDVEPGATIALVGSSGSGKTTLVGLILRFHRPDQGQILIDGRDVDSVSMMSVREQVGVVLQETFLFDGTIAENIRYGCPLENLEEIIRVSRIAHVDEFVDTFPDGYETVIGERGVKLSGGQKQRVAIARAILADPRILILDEATSSLDSESEGFIQEGLRALRKGRTSFVIAHRLSTIQSADEIFVVEGGRIVERGTHPELLALVGRYHELYTRQNRLAMDLFANPGEKPEEESEEDEHKPASGTSSVGVQSMMRRRD